MILKDGREIHNMGQYLCGVPDHTAWWDDQVGEVDCSIGFNARAGRWIYTELSTGAHVVERFPSVAAAMEYMTWLYDQHECDEDES